MKTGDFLMAKVDISIPTWYLDGEPANTFNIVKHEKCEIIRIHEKEWPSFLEVKCRSCIIGFSLVDIVLQHYEFYQKYFYEYGTSLRTIRKEKLEKIANLWN